MQPLRVRGREGRRARAGIPHGHRRREGDGERRLSGVRAGALVAQTRPRGPASGCAPALPRAYHLDSQQPTDLAATLPTRPGALGSLRAGLSSLSSSERLGDEGAQTPRSLLLARSFAMFYASGGCRPLAGSDSGPGEHLLACLPRRTPVPQRGGNGGGTVGGGPAAQPTPGGGPPPRGCPETGLVPSARGDLEKGRLSVRKGELRTLAGLGVAGGHQGPPGRGTVAALLGADVLAGLRGVLSGAEGS